MELQSITKSYDDKIVFNNFSFNFQKGKIFCITGASGSGKTTLLRIIMGLDRDFSGKIFNRPDRISVVFQEDRLLPCSVLKNITVTGADSEVAKKYLGLLGLSDAVDKLPSELSGGMKRRVALARAMCFDADMYIFDEPFAGLDENSTVNAALLIKNELKNKTVIISTHSKIAAKILTDTIIEI